MIINEYQDNKSFSPFILDYEQELVQIWKDKIAAKLSEVLSSI